MADSPDNMIPISRAMRTEAQKFGAEHDRELLTILFTDLVDSTKLQSELGKVEAARLTELHRKIVRNELAQYDAREIEWAGYSCLNVKFPCHGLTPHPPQHDTLCFSHDVR